MPWSPFNLKASPRPQMPQWLLLHALAQSYLYTLFIFRGRIYFTCFAWPWVKQPPPRFPPSRQGYKTTVPIFHEDSAQQQEKRYQEIIQKLSETATGVDLTGSDVETVKHVWWSILHRFKFGILWRASEGFSRNRHNPHPPYTYTSTQKAPSSHGEPASWGSDLRSLLYFINHVI